VKIADLEVIRLQGPPFAEAVLPAWAPGSIWTGRGAVLVKVTTDDGLIGWGTPGCRHPDLPGLPLLGVLLRPMPAETASQS